VPFLLTIAALDAEYGGANDPFAISALHVVTAINFRRLAGIEAHLA